MLENERVLKTEKIVANSTNRTKYVVHNENLELYKKVGMKVKRVSQSYRN